MQVNDIKFGLCPDILNLLISLILQGHSIHNSLSNAITNTTENGTDDPEEQNQQYAVDATQQSRTILAASATAASVHPILH